jgi:Circularly permutated YpsA SLOG family
LVCKGAEGGRWRDPGKISLQGISVSFLSQPTEWNVRDSDTTVLFPPASELTGGSKKTAEFAKKHHKTWIHLAAGDPDVAQRPTDWRAQNAVEVLNVEDPPACQYWNRHPWPIKIPVPETEAQRTDYHQCYIRCCNIRCCSNSLGNSDRHWRGNSDRRHWRGNFHPSGD